MAEIFTILEVSNLLNVTTQAVYKRLQQEGDRLDEYVTSKGGKRSLTKDGVEKLSSIMGIDNPFTPEDETVIQEEATSEPITDSDANTELLSYLKEDNRRLLEEVTALKQELNESRKLREEDHKAAESERRQHEEARMRADALLMKAMMNQEKPRLLDRIFKRKPKDNDSE